MPEGIPMEVRRFAGGSVEVAAAVAAYVSVVRKVSRGRARIVVREVASDD